MLWLPLLLVLLGAPAPGPSDGVEAQADALVKEGKLDEAFELLEQAYYAEAEPEPRLLFGMGVIALERGECDAAVGYLGRFLATSPGEQAAAKAREVIAYCEAELRAEAEPTPEPEAEPEPTPEPTPEPMNSPPAEPMTGSDDDPKDASLPWFRDGLGWGLLGTGVAVTAVGAGMLGQAQGDMRAATASPDEASFDRGLERVTTLRAIGGSLTGVGVALLIGAGVRYGVVARRTRRAGTISWSPARGGLVLRTTLRF